MRKVRELMTSDVVSVRPSDDLVRVRDRMARLDVRHMPVVEADGSFVGLISQRDLLRVTAAGEANLPLSALDDMLRRTRVSEVMQAEVATVGPDDPLGTAARILLDNKFGCLPVVDGVFLVGIITESDFVRLVAQSERS